MTKCIEVQNVSKGFKMYTKPSDRLKEWLIPHAQLRHDTKLVLQDINFSVGQGEAVGIVGINGAGKSTLLKIITGTTAPSKGQVIVRGKISALLELGLGFHPDFTGRQNVYMSGQLMGFTVKEIDECMTDVERFADIGKAIDAPVRTYSSGMSVRLAFAVATMKRPEILIVDEALAVGDLFFQAKCFARIQDFQKHGTTLLFVSHAASDMVRYCKRVLYLKNGHLFMDGSARDVTNAYLDDLFGKKRITVSSLEANNQIEDKSEEEALNYSTEDVFASRPFYRKDEYRWGLGGAKIIDYSIEENGKSFPSFLTTGSKVALKYKVFFERDVMRPVYGILIKAHDGLNIYGTNSEISGNMTVDQTSVQGGELVEVKFEFHNCLGTGAFLFSFGVTDMSTGEPGEPMDRRYDSVLIRGQDDSKILGMVDFEADFKLRRTISNNVR